MDFSFPLGLIVLLLQAPGYNEYFFAPKINEKNHPNVYKSLVTSSNKKIPLKYFTGCK